MSKVIITLLLVLGLALAAPKSHKELVENIRNSLQKDIESGKVESLSRVYNKIHTIKETGVPTLHAYTPADVCKYLSKLSVNADSSAQTIEEFIVLRNSFKCDTIEVQKTFDDFHKKIAKSDKYAEVRAAITIATRDGTFEKDKVKELCSKLVDFLGEDGYIKTNKKGEVSTLRDTTQFLETLDLCVSKNLTSSKAKEAVAKSLESLVKLARYTAEDQLAFVEDDFFVTTARLVQRILQTSSSAIPASKLVQIVNYLAANSESLVTVERVAALVGVSKYIQNVPVARLSSGAIQSGKKTSVSVSAANILGEKIEGLTAKASLNQKSNVAVENINLKNEGGNLVGEFDGSKVKAGYYTLNVELTHQSQSYNQRLAVLVQGSVSINSLRYEVTKSSSAPEGPLDYDAKYPNKNSEVLKANQNNFIHVSFKVNSDSPYVTALVRLRNSQYRFATGTIVAKQTRDTNIYSAVIDLGDPDHILPYNGIYDIEVVIGSEYAAETIVWKFASFDIKFIRPAEKQPASESDVQLLPEIKHMFPADRKKPNSMITLVFASAAAILAGIFFISVSRLGLNFQNFPSSFSGSIFSLAFLLIIFALVGILVLFWTQINLFETLTLLLVAFIPTLFVGKRAFSEMKIDN